jgi:hypothetical protein
MDEEIVDPANIGVRDPARIPEFPLESLDSVGIADDLAPNRLDRYRFTKFLIKGFPHLPHPTAA